MAETTALKSPIAEDMSPAADSDVIDSTPVTPKKVQRMRGKKSAGTAKSEDLELHVLDVNEWPVTPPMKGAPLKSEMNSDKESDDLEVYVFSLVLRVSVSDVSYRLNIIPQKAKSSKKKFKGDGENSDEFEAYSILYLYVKYRF
jgi:hypothetical protein